MKLEIDRRYLFAAFYDDILRFRDSLLFDNIVNHKGITNYGTKFIYIYAR